MSRNVYVFLRINQYIKSILAMCHIFHPVSPYNFIYRSVESKPSELYLNKGSRKFCIKYVASFSFPDLTPWLQTNGVSSPSFPHCNQFEINLGVP